VVGGSHQQKPLDPFVNENLVKRVSLLGLPIPTDHLSAELPSLTSPPTPIYRAAADKIGMTGQGVARISMTVLGLRYCRSAYAS